MRHEPDFIARLNFACWLRPKTVVPFNDVFDICDTNPQIRLIEQRVNLLGRPVFRSVSNAVDLTRELCHFRFTKGAKVPNADREQAISIEGIENALDPVAATRAHYQFEAQRRDVAASCPLQVRFDVEAHNEACDPGSWWDRKLAFVLFQRDLPGLYGKLQLMGNLPDRRKRWNVVVTSSRARDCPNES